MKTKSQAKRIQAQTTVKAWALVNEQTNTIWSCYFSRAAATNERQPYERVVRCEIRLLK